MGGDLTASGDGRAVFGDEAPWWRTLPTLYRAIAFPDGPWRPPRRPTQPGFDAHDYWNPLLHLLLGPFGWADPAQGVSRLPHNPYGDPPAIRILREWWGRDLRVLHEWDDAAAVAEEVAKMCRTATRPRSGAATTPADQGVRPQHWARLLEGKPDHLELGLHVPPMLAGRDLAQEVLVMRPDDRRASEPPWPPPRWWFEGTAVLVLSSYVGWLRILHEVADRVSEPIDVIVRPLGWLGRYRRSRETGRMYAVTEETHLAGW